MRALVLIAALALACSPESEAPAAATPRLPPPGAEAGTGAIEILAAFVPAPPADIAALYLVAQDASGGGDRLLAAHCAEAARTEIHNTRQEGGRTRMEPAVDGIPVPPGGRAVLAPGGSHVMLIGLERRLSVGDELAVELEFARAGRVALRAAVIDYAELEARTDDVAAPAAPARP